MKHLRWKERSSPNEWFHIVRVSGSQNVLPGLHTHDYAEVFWVNDGCCCHTINGQDEILGAGDLIFIRPGDRHLVRGNGRSGFSFTNLAFPAAVLEDLRQRYAEEMGHLYGAAEKLPFRERLPEHRLRELEQSALDLASAPQTRLRLEQFLCSLFLAVLPGAVQVAGNRSVPAWLRQACMRLQEPDVFRGGVRGFARVAGCCSEHLARCTRRHMGQTPHELVTDARMRFAARLLTMTSQAVTAISHECGYAHPGRFYAAFSRHFGTSPLRYRRAAV